MDTRKAATEFAALFPEVYRRFHRRISHTEYQLTSESLAVVQHLADTGPLTVTEAAKHMDRSQAAMSELIARLTGRGLLARMPDERDRRRVLVWLTPQGREALDMARSVLSDELLERAFAGISATDRRRLIETMRRLVESNPKHGKDEQ